MATIPMAGQGTIFGIGMGIGTETGTKAGSASHPSQARAQRNRELFELQRRARRGPTPEVFFAKHIDNTRIVKADDPERRREMRTFTGTMSILFLLVMVMSGNIFLQLRLATKWRRKSTRSRRCRSRIGNCV